MNITQEKNKGGRKPGSLGPKTIRKLALKVLQNVVEDDQSPVDARVQAASTLLEKLPE